MPDDGPDFALKVPQNGYAWWYVDALSDDGAHGLTLIAFVGSVFSPYYKFARRGGLVDPENFCSLNVALYSPGAARWAMTERGAGQIARSAGRFSIGPSALTWDGRGLTIDIDERAFPLIAPVRGQIRLHPQAMPGRSFVLDEKARHHWRPIAPLARIEVEMRRPALSWQGDAYFDHNNGSEPIEDGFREWDWSRSKAQESALVLYDVEARNGMKQALSLRFDAQGGVEPFDAAPRRQLAKSRWRMPRVTRSEDEKARIVRTLEDAPFYARSVIETTLAGASVVGVHESLSLDRFNMPVVQMMLPFRMPRAGNRR